MVDGLYYCITISSVLFVCAAAAESCLRVATPTTQCTSRYGEGTTYTTVVRSESKGRLLKTSHTHIYTYIHSHIRVKGKYFGLPLGRGLSKG